METGEDREEERERGFFSTTMGFYVFSSERCFLDFSLTLFSPLVTPRGLKMSGSFDGKEATVSVATRRCREKVVQSVFNSFSEFLEKPRGSLWIIFEFGGSCTEKRAGDRRAKISVCARDIYAYKIPENDDSGIISGFEEARKDASLASPFGRFW